MGVGGRRGWLIFVLWTRLLGSCKRRPPLAAVADLWLSPLLDLTIRTTVTQIMIAAAGIINPMSSDLVELRGSVSSSS